jgi:thioredoxin reductase/ferredoxin
MSFEPLLLIYLVPVLAFWLWRYLYKSQKSKRALAVLEDNRQAGLMEPPSLHPVIDPALCLGCGACARACPEKKIIGIIDGKAVLIEPTHCVGHGACKTSCPTDAISLVFGTETRGIDIPLLSPEFESTVPGIYVAGELGGMGLIRNAIEQGRQAIGFLADYAKRIPDSPDVLDAVIIGCGPAGIAASLGAMERKLDFRTIDQSSLGGTTAHFPRGKLVMTAPAVLPIVGKFQFGQVSKETLIAFWEEVIEKSGLKPQFGEQVTAVARQGDYFDVTTSEGQYRTKTVLLAIGRRGTPRPLDVPGEELPKVVYRMIDPEQYAGQRVLVVGGGDSALEAAARIADQPGSTVTLSYRGAAYSRARAKNRNDVADFVAAGKINEQLSTTVNRIEPEAIVLNCADGERTIPNDAVIVCAGGLLPTQFLRDMGVNIETKFGTA